MSKKRVTRKRMKPARKQPAGKIVTKSDTVSLSKTEATERSEHVSFIHETFNLAEKAWNRLVESGERFAALRDKRLYRSTHKTFEAFCQEEFGRTANGINKIIRSARVAVEVNGSLGTNVPKLTHESQARELAAAPPEERAQVFERAAEKAGGEPTAADIRREIEGEDSPVPEFNPDPEPPEFQIGEKGDEPPSSDVVLGVQSRFDDVIGALDEFARQIRNLADSADGRGMIRNRIDITLADLRGTLRMARPVGVCHRCNGAACEVCKTGWITLAEWRALPAAEQALVKTEDQA